MADPRTGHEHPRVVIDTPDWVNVIAVTKDEQLVLIRQYRFGIAETTLEIPGGMVEPGEDPARPPRASWRRRRATCRAGW